MPIDFYLLLWTELLTTYDWIRKRVQIFVFLFRTSLKIVLPVFYQSRHYCSKTVAIFYLISFISTHFIWHRLKLFETYSVSSWLVFLVNLKLIYFKIKVQKVFYYLIGLLIVRSKYIKYGYCNLLLSVSEKNYFKL